MIGSPVYAVQKQPSMIDFRGHLTALVFVSGCNFRCGYCHNAELLQKRQKGIEWDRLADLCRTYRDNWVDAVTISGGEPTLWHELPDLVRFFKDFDFLIKLDTNGSRPDRLATLLPDLDYVALDIKGTLEQYPQIAGFSQPDKISQSIDLLRRSDTDYEFRTTLIESIHDEAQMAEMAEWIHGARRYVLQPFVPHPDLPDVSLRQEKRTSLSFLERMAKIAELYVEQVLILGT